MIQNFDEIKSQLSELSKIINSFNSEAVQLRIIEIILGDIQSSNPTELRKNDAHNPSQKPNKRKSSRGRQKPKETNEAGEKPRKKTRASGQGANATLTDLTEGDFFASPKTINDIITHCDQNLARRFKPNEFSGKLARLTRDGTLNRDKNSDGQYEYIRT